MKKPKLKSGQPRSSRAIGHKPGAEHVAAPDQVGRPRPGRAGPLGGRLECLSHPGEEIGLFIGAGDPYALERAVELDVDVEVTGILVEVQERPGSTREVTALALPQLGELA